MDQHPLGPDFETVFSLSVHPILLSTAYLGGSYRRQYQRPYWSPDRQCPLHSPYPPGQSFHHGSLLSWSVMTFSEFTVCCWFSFHSHAWKWFPGLAALSPSQGTRWGWPARSSLHTPFSSWKQEWCFTFFNLWVLLPVAVINQRLSRVTSQWHLPAPLTLEVQSTCKINAW